MLIRLFAAVVFCLMTLGGLVVWLGSPHPLQSSAGFAAFLTGIIGLLLADIAITLVNLLEQTKQSATEHSEQLASALRRELVSRNDKVPAIRTDHSKADADSAFDAAIDEAVQHRPPAPTAKKLR